MPIRFSTWIFLSLIALAPPSERIDSLHFVFDHAWFAVAPGAMVERAALERAGLSFASGVNRHEGPRRSALQQPRGLQRVTSVRLLVPSAMRESDALQIFRSTGAAQVESGDAWCLELTFDDGVQHKVLDLRATLPLILRY